MEVISFRDGSFAIAGPQRLDYYRENNKYKQRIISKMRGNEFIEKVESIDTKALVAESITTLQVNIGRKCNQACRHCHLECGPDRTEMMDRDTLEKVAAVVKENDHMTTVDITGGAPELYADLPFLIRGVRPFTDTVIVRSNLTALVAPETAGLMKLFKEQRVTISASLPCYLEENVDMIRGGGVYRKSIETLKKLNELGYGKDLELNLVYSPAGPDLPGCQEELEAAYRENLKKEHGVIFSRLLVITNAPIARYKRYLQDSGSYDEYMTLLKDNFNAGTLESIMCRNLVSVDYMGNLYDCDFNQALDIKINHGAPNHIDRFDPEKLTEREIQCDLHCFACTAGQGSSCGGALA